MRKPNKWCLCVVLQIVVCVLASATHGQNTRGTDWVRSHDLATMAAVGEGQWYGQGLFKSSVYLDLGCSVFLPWTYQAPYQFLEKDEEIGLPWHMLVPMDDSFADGISDEIKGNIALYRYRFTTNINTGFIVADEPNRTMMDTVASAQDWLRQEYPDAIVYTNLRPEGKSDAWYYGDTPPAGGYDYEQYLDDYISITNPDILMYDNYPFLANGSTNSIFFSNMAIIRQKALAAGIPYWAWIQSYVDNDGYYRTPSGSDLRMQVFAHLTYGFTGISYFTYNNLVGEAMVGADPNNTPTQLYVEAQNINPMVATLGQCLKYLTSTDVRYIAGSGNPVPSGAVAWSAGAGGDAHITGISMSTTGSANNGLIGFFADDSGDQYFMFTNLKHGASLTPGAASLQFTITFDSSVNEILRLNSLTGETEVLALTNHQYTWDLAGGTGDLFKYNTDSFYTGPLQTDLNGDGKVDALDFADFAEQWQMSK